MPHYWLPHIILWAWDVFLCLEKNTLLLVTLYFVIGCVPILSWINRNFIYNYPSRCATLFFLFYFVVTKGQWHSHLNIHIVDWRAEGGHPRADAHSTGPWQGHLPHAVARSCALLFWIVGQRRSRRPWVALGLTNGLRTFLTTRLPCHAVVLGHHGDHGQSGFMVGLGWTPGRIVGNVACSATSLYAIQGKRISTRTQLYPHCNAEVSYYKRYYSLIWICKKRYVIHLWKLIM